MSSFTNAELRLAAMIPVLRAAEDGRISANVAVDHALAILRTKAVPTGTHFARVDGAGVLEIEDQTPWEDV